MRLKSNTGTGIAIIFEGDSQFADYNLLSTWMFEQSEIFFGIGMFYF
jgi:hypothetical protein